MRKMRTLLWTPRSATTLAQTIPVERITLPNHKMLVEPAPPMAQNTEPWSATTGLFVIAAFAGALAILGIALSAVYLRRRRA